MAWSDEARQASIEARKASAKAKGAQDPKRGRAGKVEDHREAARLHEKAADLHSAEGNREGAEHHEAMAKLHDEKIEFHQSKMSEPASKSALAPKITSQKTASAVDKSGDSEKKLGDKLQSDSSRPMIPDAARQLKNDPDKDLILERGKFTSGSGKTQMIGAEGQCHWNTAKLFKDGKIDSIVIGYAHNPSAGWHQHTWGLKSGKIVETTASNVSSTRYFGATLSKSESTKFAHWAEANPPGGGVVRYGPKGKL